MTPIFDLIEPIDWQLYQDLHPKGNWYELLKANAEQPLSEMDMAIVTVLDTPESAFAFRKRLYACKKGSQNYRIKDLGEWPALHRHLLPHLCVELLKNKVIPLVVGAQTTAACAHLAAHFHLKEQISSLLVLPTVENTTGAVHHSSALSWLFEQKFNGLEHLTIMGYKEYASDQPALQRLHKLGFDMLSLGRMRDLRENIEPLIRTAQVTVFELSTIRFSNSAHPDRQSIFGLDAEESVRIAWYAGASAEMQSFGIYGLENPLQPEQAELCSVMLWYFAEGYAHRQTFQKENSLKYYVPIHDFGQETLVFYKLKNAPIWWIELPPTLFNAVKILPCAASDYANALQGEIPERWLRFLQKR
ncbi:MAG: hypothetical protein EAZ57_08490 [Cytophagales bacterium]|nr:MAG: hypothetical protein EAZ67_05690 [Cytophagales bacterium]TAF60183.1 MAG: hypothetical protein EAZ57_08490 [Cytophagales bacterium]